MIFNRSFIGLYIFGLRVGEILTAGGFVIAIIFLLLPKNYLKEIYFNDLQFYSLKLIVVSFFIVGLITAVFGGRPGMISGATGALAVVMVSLVTEHGTEYLFATVVLMGVLQLLAGVFKLGKFIRMVPEPVMLGFVNGLAIVIGISQLLSLIHI